MTRIKNRYLALLAALLWSTSANAVPISYHFVTDNSPFGDPGLSLIFSGLSVSGSFIYDSDTPATGTVPGGPVAGSTIYLGSTSDLDGSVGAFSFSDPIGRAIVGDDRFLGSNDFFQLSADPLINSGAPPGAFGLIGFEVAGFTLVNVRMNWIEGQLGISDFLSDQNLPGVLPSFQGRLAFDFTPTQDPGVLSSVFFNGLRVEQVPEPGTLALLVVGLLGLGFSRSKSILLPLASTINTARTRSIRTWVTCSKFAL